MFAPAPGIEPHLSSQYPVTILTDISWNIALVIKVQILRFLDDDYYYTFFVFRLRSKEEEVKFFFTKHATEDLAFTMRYHNN
jgi:hypothetical protein